MPAGERIRFWESPALAGVELLQARYIKQRFTPHVHEGFVFTVIEGGAQRFRHRGLPPHAWLQQRRLEQARALLRDGCAPLSVALQLGFADQSHLTRQFKQVYGVGPGEYRKACQRSP